MANNYTNLRDSLLTSPESRARHRELKDELIEVSKLIHLIDQTREKQGLTKKELAELAGIEPANVRRLLSANPKNLSLLTLLRLARALRLSLTLR